MIVQRAVTPKVGRNKSSQFRRELDVTLLPQLRKALFRPTAWLAVAALLLAGCNASAPAPATPSNVQVEASNPTEVTLYLAGMNQSMQILGGDGPNKVKQALLELDGVESVEDEWERELESNEDLDLLFVKYEPKQITLEQLKAAISEHGFEAQVKGVWDAGLRRQAEAKE